MPVLFYLIYPQINEFSNWLTLVPEALTRRERESERERERERERDQKEKPEAKKGPLHWPLPFRISLPCRYLVQILSLVSYLGATVDI